MASTRIGAAHPLRMGPRLTGDAQRAVRREMELSHFKWDDQVGDSTSLAPFPLLISPSTWSELAGLTELLAAETVAMEAELVERPSLYPRIALPRPLAPLLANGPTTPPAARIMRFDFHYTTEGWRISEVNSDVPGGFTEATNFAWLMAAHVPGARVLADPAGSFVDTIGKNIEHGETVALTNAPGHMEDHQVVAYLAERLREKGFVARVVSLETLRWRDGRAHIENAVDSHAVGAVVRFYQVEWLAQLPKAPWTYLFAGGQTPVANPGTAAVTESKRLPLVWEDLRATQPTWRKLLPETRDPRDAPWMDDEGWLVKAAYSNTGDTVAIRDAMTQPDWARVAGGGAIATFPLGGPASVHGGSIGRRRSVISTVHWGLFRRWGRRRGIRASRPWSGHRFLRTRRRFAGIGRAVKRSDVHRCWVPDAAPWSLWVKPVLFASLDVEVTPRPITTVLDWPPQVLADLVALRAPLDSAPEVGRPRAYATWP